MSDKDNFDVDEKELAKPEPATRARNRTVMLTPDITGQVRAKLSQGGTQVATPYSNRDGDVAATISPHQVAPGRGFYSQMVQQPVEEERKVIIPPAAPQLMQTSPVVTEEQRPGIIKAPAIHPRTTTQRDESDLRDLGIWVNRGPLIGFLVSYSRIKEGEVCSLRSGRMIVTSTPQTSGNYLLIDDESVSSLHAIIRITPSGEIQVLDQLSESGTFIRRFATEEEIELSGEKSFLEHGDLIRFGEIVFHVSMIMRSDSEV